jgi:glycosyltransferase involved in cell wall biosynthesis
VLENKIKIAYIIDQLAYGGTEKQLINLISNIDLFTFDVTLILLRGSGNFMIPPANIQILNLEINSLSKIESLIKINKLARYLKAGEFDVVQTFFQDATFVGVIAAKMAGVKKIFISIRDMLFWSNPATLYLHKKLSNFADGIIVNSKAVKERISILFPKKPIYVIHNGILIEDRYIKNRKDKKSLCLELGIKETIPIVTLISNCNREVKRVDLLIEAITSVIKQSTAYFLIVGDGHLRASLEEKAKDLGIMENTKFLGQRLDIERILAGSDMALNTSESEGLSNSILEAMRAGLPNIVSDVAGNRELINDSYNGLVFESGNAGELSKKILYLINDSEKRQIMGNNGRKKLEMEFSNESMLNKYYKLYYD